MNQITSVEKIPIRSKSYIIAMKILWIKEAMNLYWLEEEYLSQRGLARWALCGEANTAYFHVAANEKC
jgi:hypothetical protein